MASPRPPERDLSPEWALSEEAAPCLEEEAAREQASAPLCPEAQGGHQAVVFAPSSPTWAPCSWAQRSPGCPGVAQPGAGGRAAAGGSGGGGEGKARRHQARAGWADTGHLTHCGQWGLKRASTGSPGSLGAPHPTQWPPDVRGTAEVCSRRDQVPGLEGRVKTA